MDFPLISVIVPVYNVEPYLPQCLESIVAQTYPNLEVILVDDGSTDNCGKICDSYAEKYPRFKVIHKANAGPGQARNCGLMTALGKYCIFVDSDDYIEEKLTEQLYLAAMKYKADTVISSNFLKIDEKGNISRPEQRVLIGEFFQGREIIDKCLARIMGSSGKIRDSIRPTVWGTLYSMKLIRKYQIHFDENECFSEDRFFMIQYYPCAETVYLAPIIGYCYRQNEKSITRSYRKNLLKRIQPVYEYESAALRALGAGEDVQNRIKIYALIHIRSCMLQEFYNPFLSDKRLIVERIKIIVSDPFVQDIVRSYSGDLTLAQWLFVMLCKWKLAYLLFILLPLSVKISDKASER